MYSLLYTSVLILLLFTPIPTLQEILHASCSLWDEPVSG